MRYVQRDQTSATSPKPITGTFANPQPGFAEEALEDGDPEIVAFDAAAAARLAGQ